MDIDIRFFLAFIIIILIAITILLFFILRHLKKFVRFEWSLAYPELAGMYDGQADDFMPDSNKAHSIGEQLDMMLEEEPMVQDINHREKFESEISNKQGDSVLCTAYAPDRVEKDEEFIIAAFASLPHQKEEVEEAAKLIDDELIKRAEKFLNLKVDKGDEVLFVLRVDGCEIDDPTQSIIWQGEIASVEFGVTVLDSFAGKKLMAKLQISVKGIPAGMIKFKIKVETDGLASPAENAAIQATNYKNAFISYASPDRNEVLRRTQMLSATGISFFQDIMQLKPGELWEQSLYKEIDKCDVFFLFWSSSAKNSKWVMEEYRYAQSLKSQGNAIEIVPIPIEGPPAPEPPEELSHLHFNDGFLYFIRN